MAGKFPKWGESCILHVRLLSTQHFQFLQAHDWFKTDIVFFFPPKKGWRRGRGPWEPCTQGGPFSLSKRSFKTFLLFHFIFKSENDRPIVKLGDRIRRWTLNQLIDSRTGKGANNIHVHFSEFFIYKIIHIILATPSPLPLRPRCQLSCTWLPSPF